MLTNLLKSSAETMPRRVVLELLSELQDGYLKLVLPEGKELEFGSSASPQKALIRVRREDFFKKCLWYGDVGFGEAYVDGDWDTDSIANVIGWMILNIEKNPALSGSSKRVWPVNLFKWANQVAHAVRPNSIRGSRKNIEEHYDLGNNFFELFLDPSRFYSCALFTKPDEDLEAAQWRKCDTLCRKLQLKADDHVLEIGTGWGGFALHAAKTYGCRVTTVTISKQQLAYATERIRAAGLSDRVTVMYCDYRNITGQYDKIVSIEMLEAVGHKYLPTYFEVCQRVLKKNGLLGLQVIICPDNRYDLLRKSVDWIQRHIFPGSLLPSIAAVNSAINQTGDFFLYDLEDMGKHYPVTLARWRDALNANSDKVKALGFDEAFIRKWNYYFSYCEAAFAMRNISVVQMIYAHPNNPVSLIA